MTSTDIGVAENGTEAIGLSWLKGTGTKYTVILANYDSKYGYQWGILFDCKNSFSCAYKCCSKYATVTPTTSWDAVTGAVSYRNLQWYYFSSSNDQQ
jgi:hypothetical protein